MSNVEESLETQARIGALRCEGGPHSPTGGLLRRLADEIEQLRVERDTFYMDYRMKCDEETKALHVERDRLRAEVAALNQPVKLSEWQELVAERDELLALLCRARPYVEQDDSGLTRKGAEDFVLLERIDAALGGEGK